MKEKGFKLLVWGDGGAPTGFARVNHEIIKALPENVEVHHLAINYRGDPHNYKHQMYPAALGGDYMGVGRVHDFADKDFDLIYLLNDVWVIADLLKRIKQTWKKIPPIVAYFPVDATNFHEQWFEDFDIVTTSVVYTKFGSDVVKKTVADLDPVIIPHGTNTDIFYSVDKEKAKQTKYKSFPELWKDSFIILNANRNQPRKKLDVAFEGFALFAENKPKNVLYYHHSGLRDIGWDISTLIKRFNLSDKVILTNTNPGIQGVSLEELNIIYNATDVGLNTSLGEGWGLTSTEHAVTGAVQVVPDHSACAELFRDCGLLIPISAKHTYRNTMTVGRLVTPEDVATQLERLYSEKDLLKNLSYKCQAKFSQYEYSWEYVAKKFYAVFLKAITKS
jgi:glycosyltransferase involved in cell wall biosynthesis